MSRKMIQFRKRLVAGDPVGALMIAPFGYVSCLRPEGGYHFRILADKWHRPGVGEGPTLLDAMRAADAKAQGDRP